jgi:uncharacterized membrane protein YphA (DoxX/SURF4 family)
MHGLLRAGRIIFAIAMVFFGVQFLIFATSMTGPLPGPPWARGGISLAWLCCAGFIVCGVSIAAGMMARWAAMLLGAAVLLFALIRWVPDLVAHLHNPGPWTVVFELLAISGGAFVLAASLSSPDGTWNGLAAIGRYMVAVSLVIFAVQHFMYAGFVATLVPAWIPRHLFWAYFTGAAFVAVALSFAAGKMVRLSAGLLGLMFLLWVLLLHVPRVAASPRNGDEVTSLFVALAMCGVSFILAGAWENNRRVWRLIL